jgi:hypothetical protein
VHLTRSAVAPQLTHAGCIGFIYPRMRNGQLRFTWHWALKGQGIEGTDEVTTIRRTTLRLFGVVVLSSLQCLQRRPFSAHHYITRQFLPAIVGALLKKIGRSSLFTSGVRTWRQT